MDPIIYILASDLVLFINVLCGGLLLTRKRKVKNSLCILVLNFLILMFVQAISYAFLRDTILHIYIILCSYCSIIIYGYLVFEESFYKIVFTMVTVWLFSSIILIMSSYIISLLHIKSFYLYKTLATLLRGGIQLVIMPFIYTYFKRPYNEMLKLVSNKVINIVFFYSITILVFLLSYYRFNDYMAISSYGIFNNFMIMIIIMLSYIIIFITIQSVNRNMELEYKFKIIDTQIELQKQNYKTLSKSIENYYAFKHDIRHHIFFVKSLMDAKDYIAASEYLNKFSKTEICENIDILCENFTVDSMLKYYMNIAKNYNIDFRVKTNIPQNINIENLDLTIIIGNCTENAIEACNKITGKAQKYIDIKAEIKGFNLILKIKNSFNGVIIKEGDIIKTSKEGQGHGIGLSNVRKIAEKNAGFFDIKYTDNEFEVSIIMNFS